MAHLTNLDGVHSWLARLTAGVNEETMAVAKSVIDERANDFKEEIKVNTPRDTGDLASSVILVQDKGAGRGKGRGWYGYRVQFDGYNEKGVPYQLIANSLNYGTVTRDGRGEIAPILFLESSRHKLRGMDKEILDRINEVLAKRGG